MKFTNFQMALALEHLAPLLERTDLIGYAAARNTRLLRQEAAEYLEARERLVCELGEQELDGDGQPTGVVAVHVGTPAFDEFRRRMAELDGIEAKLKVFRVPVGKAIGKLSGTQLLALDWMFEED